MYKQVTHGSPIQSCTSKKYAKIRNWSNQNLNPALKTKTSKTLLQKFKTQREHMVNWVSSFFPKGGHSATETKLKIIWTHVRWNVNETLTSKTGKRDKNHNNKTTVLEWSVMNYLGADSSFTCTTSPSVSEVTHGSLIQTCKNPSDTLKSLSHIYYHSQTGLYPHMTVLYAKGGTIHFWNSQFTQSCIVCRNYSHMEEQFTTIAQF